GRPEGSSQERPRSQETPRHSQGADDAICGLRQAAQAVESILSPTPQVSRRHSRQKGLSMTTISDERLAEMKSVLELPIGAAVVKGGDLADLRSILTELQTLRAQGGVRVPTERELVKYIMLSMQGHDFGSADK